MQLILQDIRYALRMMLSKPGLTAVAVLTLAVGISVNTTIYSVVDALVFRPFPFHDMDRIMTLWTVKDGRLDEREAVVPADFIDWQKQNTAFEQLAAYQSEDVNITGVGDPEYVRGARVTANFFGTLGVGPAYGRLFSPKDSEAGNHRVAVVSHILWQQRFGGDPNFIGTELVLNGETATVIGIIPPYYNYPLEQDIWTPLVLTAEDQAERTRKSLAVFGRLKPGASETQAQSEMELIDQRIAEQYPQIHEGQKVSIISFMKQNGDEVADIFSYTLFGAVFFVLLIACANVANLQLARATGRQKEMALRAALGANSKRVVRQLLTESLFLAVIAGLLGLLLAGWGIDVIKGTIPANIVRFVPMWSQMALSGSVLAFTALIVLLTGIVAGLAPALQASRADLNQVLTDSARGSSGGLGRRRLRSGLVVTEVALALVLLVGSGLMIQGFIGMLNKNIGIDPVQVLTMRITLPETKYADPIRTTAFYREAYNKLAAVPGVVSVGGANYLHADNTSDMVPVEIEGQPALNASELPRVNRHIVSTGYMPAMRIPLLQGRMISEADHDQAAPTVVVSKSFAQRFWPEQDPIGRHVKMGITPSVDGKVIAEGPWRLVVGVVDDATYSWFEAQPRATVYLSSEQAPRRWMNVVVRTAGPPTALTSAIRSAIIQLDPEQAVAEIRTMEDVIRDRLAGVRVATFLMGLFGLISVIMAAVGIYSVISYSVAQRTHEIGIRMAIGARQRDVVTMVLRQGLTLTAIGLAIGLPISYALSILLQEGLVVLTFNPITFLLLTLLLVAISTAASIIPARRATRVDPMIALRTE